MNNKPIVFLISSIDQLYEMSEHRFVLCVHQKGVVENDLLLALEDDEEV